MFSLDGPAPLAIPPPPPSDSFCSPGLGFLTGGAVLGLRTQGKKAFAPGLFHKVVTLLSRFVELC